MIKGFGGAWVLAGHSERRNLCGEIDSFIGQKLSRFAESWFEGNFMCW